MNEIDKKPDHKIKADEIVGGLNLPDNTHIEIILKGFIEGVYLAIKDNPSGYLDHNTKFQEALKMIKSTEQKEIENGIVQDIVNILRVIKTEDNIRTREDLMLDAVIKGKPNYKVSADKYVPTSREVSKTKLSYQELYS